MSSDIIKPVSSNAIMEEKISKLNLGSFSEEIKEEEDSSKNESSSSSDEDEGPHHPDVILELPE